MNREQLAHILRAAAEIVDDPEIVVIGSQSLLGSVDEDVLPDAATASMALDLTYLDDPADQKSDAVDGALGEWSPFHQTHGVYAQGVSITTAVLPAGWQDRVVSWSNRSTGRAAAVFLEPHDCVVSKLVAHRPKDLAFAAALLDAGLISPATLAERISALPESVDPVVRAQAGAWLAARGDI